MMIRSLGVAAGLLLLACTPELPLEAPPEPTSAILSATLTTGVVERFPVLNGYVVNDVDAGLQSTIGFDQERWCADGSPGVIDYVTEHEFQRTWHPDGRVTEVVRLEGILVVSDGSVFDCGHPALGYGWGRMEMTVIRQPAGFPDGPTPPNVRKNEWHGYIVTAAGGTHQVSAFNWSLTGWQQLDQFFQLIQARILVH